MPLFTKENVDVVGVVGVAGVAAGVAGGVAGGVVGSVGKYSLSFFNSQLANNAGNFYTFCGVGALASAINILPCLINKKLTEKNSFLKEKPNLRAFLSETLNTLTYLGSLTAAASILNAPIAATVICMMIIPAVVHLAKTIKYALAAALGNNETPDLSLQPV